MPNIRILARNWAEARNGGSISSSPAMLPGLPVDNLILPTERDRTARSTSLAAQAITVAFDASRKVNAVAFSRVNWTTASTLRSRVRDGATATLYDTTALAGYSTTGLDTDIDDYTDADFVENKNTIQYITEQTASRSILFDIADAANPDGYIEQTKVFAGKYFEPSYNAASLEFTVIDASIQGRADDGSHLVDKRWKTKQVVLTLEPIPEDSDFATLMAIARYLGKDGECFLDPYPTSQTARGIYARGAYRLVDVVPFGPREYGLQKTTMKFEGT